QLQIRNRLPCNKRNELKSDIENDLRQDTGRCNIHNDPTQMVPGAALLGAAFLDRDVLASNTNIEIHVFSAGIRCCQLSRTHAEYRESSFPAFYAAGNNCFDTHGG